MKYVKNNIIYNIQQIRALHLDISLREGADLTDIGYSVLFETPRPDAELYHHVIQGPVIDSTQTWVQVPFDIEVVRTRVLDRVSEENSITLLDGILFNGNVFDSDALSINRISGAVTLVLAARIAGSDFETDWILKDNTTTHLTGNDIIGLGQAAALQQQTCIFNARIKKDLINSLTTIEELMQVV
jgi:hypothetical protein